MKKDKVVDKLELLKDWYKPTKRGEQARALLEAEHPAWFPEKPR